MHMLDDESEAESSDEDADDDTGLSSHVDSNPDFYGDWYSTIFRRQPHLARLTVAHASAELVDTFRGKQHLMYKCGVALESPTYVVWVFSSRLQEMVAAHGRQNLIFRKTDFPAIST
ncbi:hypothetical protein V8E54_003665 [Elaphomyces granulatus]